MATKKRTHRERRRERVENLHASAELSDFGIRYERQASGREVVRWWLDRDPYLALLALPYVRQLLDEVERSLVISLREQGFSWEELGWSLNITGEAARRRHGQDAP